MRKTKKLDITKGFKYYCMGLTSKEIGKLLGCSFRSVQNYMSSENWKQRRSELKKKEQADLKKSILEEIRSG